MIKCVTHHPHVPGKMLYKNTAGTAITAKYHKGNLFTLILTKSSLKIRYAMFTIGIKARTIPYLLLSTDIILFSITASIAHSLNDSI